MVRVEGLCKRFGGTEVLKDLTIPLKGTRPVEEAIITSGGVKVSEIDPTVGIVSILQFDLPTPEQFEAEVDALIAKGCTKFVFDVRNNPGGYKHEMVKLLDLIMSRHPKSIKADFHCIHQRSIQWHSTA